jgi:hypothetical protein
MRRLSPSTCIATPRYDDAQVDEDGFGLTAKEARRREKVQKLRIVQRQRQVGLHKLNPFDP